MSVFTEEGDIFIYDHAQGTRRQITRTVDAETSPRFTFDQKHIYFARLNNLYVMSLDGGSLEQLTDIRAGEGVCREQIRRERTSKMVLKREEAALLIPVVNRAG